MEVNRKLYESVRAAAGRATVERIIIGLGYTAVTTTAGGIGIAATDLTQRGGDGGKPEVEDYEDRPASDLLAGILKPDPMVRAMALALINALTNDQAKKLPDDPGNTILFDRFGILKGARVAMVGYFPPLVRYLEQSAVPLSIIDAARGLGDQETFYRRLESWADVLLLTATSLINNTMEDLLMHAGPRMKTVILGPSTPMLPGAFDHLPVHMLAGTAITDRSGALKVVRHGGGTRTLKPVSRKIYCLTEGRDPKVRCDSFFHPSRPPACDGKKAVSHHPDD